MITPEMKTLLPMGMLYHTCIHSNLIFRPRSSLQFGSCSVWLKTADSGLLELQIYICMCYIYTYGHLSFKKGAGPAQARSRALVDIYKMEKFSVYTPSVYRNFNF